MEDLLIAGEIPPLPRRFGLLAHFVAYVMGVISALIVAALTR